MEPTGLVRHLRHVGLRVHPRARHPESGFYGRSADATLAEVLSLFLGFAAFSVSFWAYFRFRAAWRRVEGPGGDRPPRQLVT